MRAHRSSVLLAVVLLAHVAVAFSGPTPQMFSIRTHQWATGTWSWYTGPAPVQHADCPHQYVNGPCVAISPGTKLYFQFGHAGLDPGRGIDLVELYVQGGAGRCSFELVDVGPVYEPQSTNGDACAGYGLIADWRDALPGWGASPWKLTIQCTSECPAYIQTVTVHLGYSDVLPMGAGMEADPVVTALALTSDPGTISGCVKWNIRGSYWYPDISGRIHWGDGSPPTLVHTRTDHHTAVHGTWDGTFEACHPFEAQLTDYQLTLEVWNDRWQRVVVDTRDVNLVPNVP